MLNWSVFDWSNELLRIISHVPPGILFRKYPFETIKRGSPKLEAAGEDYSFRFITDRNWTINSDWLDGWLEIMRLLIPWMEGKPLVELASIITGKTVSEISSRRTAGSQPIPKTIALINDLFSSLSILGGGIVAVAEQLFYEFAENGNEAFAQGVPLALSCMPMCIKYGCDSPGALAWYRFGVRLRRPSRCMYEAFPPPELDDDERLRNWVRNQRREWLLGTTDDSGGIFQENAEIFQAILDFIRRE